MQILGATGRPTDSELGDRGRQAGICILKRTLDDSLAH